MAISGDFGTILGYFKIFGLFHGGVVGSIVASNGTWFGVVPFISETGILTNIIHRLQANQF